MTTNTSTYEFQTDTILKIGEHLYLSEEIADFHFIFELPDGQYERIPSHKILLVTASDVFRAMFNGSWLEMVEVKIVDAPIDAFKQFLQFFYLARGKVSVEHIAKVMYLGHKYNMTECLKTCEQLIINSLNEDNICWAYELGIRFNRMNLKKYCETNIGINTKAVLESEHFLECDSKVLQHIMKLDSLSCPESEVFEACMNWVKATANVDQLTREIVQAQLGETFYEIRFKSITPQEFAMLVPSYGEIFSVSEYMHIIQLVAIPEIQSNMFSVKRRTLFETHTWDEEFLIECDRWLTTEYSTELYFIKKNEKTTFSANQPLLLTAFECNAVWERENIYNNRYVITKCLPVEISIVQIPGSTQPGETIVVYRGNGILQSMKREYVTLLKPILVRPGFKYEIHLKLSPPLNGYTRCKLMSEVQMQSNIVVQFHDDPTVGSCKVARGMIRWLKFIRIF